MHRANFTSGDVQLQIYLSTQLPRNLILISQAVDGPRRKTRQTADGKRQTAEGRRQKDPGQFRKRNVM
jgi:hypothetical protein